MGEGAEGVLFPQGKLWRTSRVLTVSSVRNRAFLKLFVSQKHKAHSFLLISFINQTSYTCAIHKWANMSLVLTNHNPPSKAAWPERGLISCIRAEFIVFFSLSNISFLRVAVLDIVGEVSAWTLDIQQCFQFCVKNQLFGGLHCFISNVFREADRVSVSVHPHRHVCKRPYSEEIISFDL